jgi:hypothetical protein
MFLALPFVCCGIELLVCRTPIGRCGPGLVTQDPAFNSRAQCFDKRKSSRDSNVLPAVALNFANLVLKVFPIAISSAAMVKEKGRPIGIGIFELYEQFSNLDSPAA